MDGASYKGENNFVLKTKYQLKKVVGRRIQNDKKVENRLILF